MRKYKSVIYIILISTFYIIIFSKLNFGKCLEILGNLNMGLFIIAALLIPIFFFLLIGYRWSILMNTQKIYYSYRESLIMCLKGFSAGVITPGKLGEFIKFFRLVNDGHPSFPSLSITMGERLIDLVFLGFVAYISLFKFINSSKRNILIYGILFLLALAFILYFIFKLKIGYRSLKVILLKIIPNKIQETYLINLNNSYLSFKNPTKYQSILILCLSFSAMMISFLTVYLLALSLGINMSFLEAVSCYSISTLATLIPVSLYGIGVRDISLIALFSHYGLSSESAIAFSALLLIAYIISGVICSIAWILKSSINKNINIK